MNKQALVSDSDRKQVRENWLQVQQEVAAACETAKRHPSEVTIVGVTKYVDAAMTGALVDAGCTHLGENRPQALWDKATALAPMNIHWHLIGHLQRNKASRTVPIVHRVHSLDSLRLARAIDAVGRPTACLLEVNISGDSSKHGFAPDAIALDLIEINRLPNITVKGLMGMASAQRRGEDAASDFQALQALRDQLSSDTGIALPELSMGMSGDFPVAIACGATMVRIGSRLFSGTNCE